MVDVTTVKLSDKDHELIKRLLKSVDDDATKVVHRALRSYSWRFNKKPISPDKIKKMVNDNLYVNVRLEGPERNVNCIAKRLKRLLREDLDGNKFQDHFFDRWGVCKVYAAVNPKLVPHDR